METMEATPHEIEICLDEAREENPEANEDEIWRIGARIYENAKKYEINY